MRYQRVATRRITLRAGVMPIEHPFHHLSLAVTVAPAEWRPRADICETPREITVLLDLAGVDEDDIAVGLYEDALVIEGERPTEPWPAGARFHLAEIRRGPFRIEVILPVAIDADRIDAAYDRGLLRVSLPKVGARDP